MIVSFDLGASVQSGFLNTQFPYKTYQIELANRSDRIGSDRIDQNV